MKYMRINDFIKEYKLEKYKLTIHQMVFSPNWYNDDDNEIYMQVFMAEEDKVLDDIYVAVIDYEEVDDNTTSNIVVKILRKKYKLLPTTNDKLKGTFMYIPISNGTKEEHNE